MKSARLCAALLYPCFSHAFFLKGFTGTQPDVPSNDPDLVLEQVWALDATDLPTHIEWVPGSTQVVTSQKIGFMRLYESIDSDVNEYIELIDMRPDVWSYGDHGIMNFKFHPDFENGVEKAFILYTGEPKNVNTLPNNAAVMASRPDGWGMGPPELLGYTWLDVCPCLDCDGTGDNHFGAICEHPYYVDRVAVDLVAGTMTKEITLIEYVCGSSTSHGPGTMLFVNGDMLISAGDGSQFSELDPGFPEDGCYDPAAGLDQGTFRAQREEFGNGKVTRIPAALIDSNVQLTLADVSFVAKGLRQPFRMFHRTVDDVLWIGDVGFGDGGTTERIFNVPGVSELIPGTAMSNFGWPCIEGVYSSAADALLGNYNPWDTASETERLDYLDANNLDTCSGVQLAVEALVGGTALDDGADAMWVPPFYEYRVGVLDPEFPDECSGDLAAITSVFFYDGGAMPEEFSGKLIFSDYVNQCLFYFDNDADGNPDTSVSPHILTSQLGFIDMQIGNDGAIYGIDYTNLRVVRLYNQGKGPSEDAGPTLPPTLAPTSAPFAIPTDIPEALMCFDSKDMPELEWSRQDDGSYIADLAISAVTFETADGYVRTRAYNGMIPGPLMRMKPCGTYILNVYNDMADWPAYTTNDENVMKDPTVTNIHLHGLHISGMAPGDDVFTVVMPGETGVYQYIVPCDHTAGTNWYHPHHHGATALQADGGAAGLLIIEPSPRESSGTPMEIQSMPEQFLLVMEFEPAKIAAVARNSNDKLFETDLTESFMLVNGCLTAAEITLEAGQWTHLHVLNFGYYYNAVYNIAAEEADEEECSVMLLGKDGVPVANAPRVVPNNNMFMSISSRIDIAVRCPTAGVAHQLLYEHINDVLAPEAPLVLALITVVPSTQTLEDDLPAWNPCRPAYLVDIYSLPQADLADLYAFEVRESLNGNFFVDADTYLFEMTIGLGQPWSTTGSDQHPFHVHVNHMQFGATIGNNQWTEVDGWNEQGDWVDTLSAPGIVIVYVRPERYTSRMVLHCHIAEHSDAGILGIVNITGEGDDGQGSPEITDFGTCEEIIPSSTPYDESSQTIPGVIEAEYFDEGGEGIAYHNINIDENTGNSIRADTAVEIRTVEDVTYVGSIRKGEWLKYSAVVENDGYYTISLVTGAVNPPNGMKWTLWVDVDECPASSQEEGKILVVADDAYAGTGSYDVFDQYDVDEPFELVAGEHFFTFCFEISDLFLSLDSFTFTYCGATVDDCDAENDDADIQGNEDAEDDSSANQISGTFLSSMMVVLLSCFYYII